MFGLGPNLDVKKNLTLTCMLPMKVDFYMTKNGGTKIVGIFNIFHLNIENLIGLFRFSRLFNNNNQDCKILVFCVLSYPFFMGGNFFDHHKTSCAGCKMTDV